MTNYFHEYVEKMYQHITLQKLYEFLKNSIPRMNRVRVDVRKALGYVLAEEIVAKHDRPLKDISHVDGFAVRSSDVTYASRYNPVRLKIVKGVDPRKADTYVLGRGETVFVETGYPIPREADAVIPIEEVIVRGDYVFVEKSIPRYYHVFKKASDFRAGELVFTPKTRITPLIQKVLLDLGYSEVIVYRRPRVAVFSIGSELKDKPYDPLSSHLPASTQYLDKYSLEYYGARVDHVGILPDDPGEIVDEIKSVLENVDLVITIGGVSMGPKDHTWISLYNSLRPKIWWRGVRVFPGRSNSGMIVGNKPVINQPGLHQSSLTTLILILTPLINYMQGLELKPIYPCIEARLTSDLFSGRYIDHYRIHYLVIDGNGHAQPIPSPGSYHLKPMAMSMAFTVIEPGIERIREESVIDACFYPPIHGPKNYLERVLIS